MPDQINRDEERSEIAGEIVVMRASMPAIKERARLGDREPILVNCFFIPAALQRSSAGYHRKPTSLAVRERHGCTEILR
jgi:hypothetical protein